MQKSEVSPRGVQASRSQKSGKLGFTLVELLLVLLILAVLAAVVVPKFTGRSEEAKITAVRTQLSSFKTALSLFEHDNGRLPTDAEGLQSLVTQPTGAQNWHRYLDEDIPEDPWGTAYGYRCPGQHNPDGFDVFSAGPDKREGTADDIGNWK